MNLSDDALSKIRSLLEPLYPDRVDEVAGRLDELAGRYTDLPKRDADGLWDERDIVLITYGDQVRGGEGAALAAQTKFLLDHGLKDGLSTVHLLPCFPYSSDDGFSVIDYREIDPDVGTWDDVAALGEQFDVMYDLVLNHCSQHSDYFKGYLAGTEPYTNFFIEADPEDERLAMVTRPRSLPLLTQYASSRGDKHVWTTFSDDQVDLNFAEPDVLVEMFDVLLTYAKQGGRIIRLDAIAYLWKKLGTNCIHLPETHAVVKLMRVLLDELAPGTILLTETNVPHSENVGYFGDNVPGENRGDEAQMVYQFSLAPLLLDAFLHEDATYLIRWLAKLEHFGGSRTYFNFTASHDGIGVRPLEGLVPPERVQELADAVKARGGRVSTRRNADGSDSPYELNITYFSAMADSDSDEQSDRPVRRFLASQAVMLALRGIPGVYFHSLIGTLNDLRGMAKTGRARTINRRKFELDELEGIVNNESSPQAVVFNAYRSLLKVRRKQQAFHPDAPQSVFADAPPELVVFARRAVDESQTILVACNTSSKPVELPAAARVLCPKGTDLITGESLSTDRPIPPLRTVWLDAGH
ncbi:sugar phosphorylase [Stratiformator vulcanicus]|uniref:Sucrose phosphorylase n=1 Tax=Stratiformator vulcanicus TaxID=2527980 RepID=A0A517QXL2_9PLAN|nr:sugar phosphorylase [Stratiformator vulcanicus]QDT36328.1 Sucrose phosphorylase [Stratiformator vulcanicus]